MTKQNNATKGNKRKPLVGKQITGKIVTNSSRGN